MPNWVNNEIRCNDKKGFLAVSNFLRSEKSLVDFNKIIPMPEGTFMGGVNEEIAKEHPLNWYDWSKENWGTKWNASNVTIDEDELKISFFTAWTRVLGLMGLLARYTGTGFTYYTEYEDGTNEKFVINKRGMVVMDDGKGD